MLTRPRRASITTIIRAPYIQHYWTPTDNLNYWTGYIVLMSNIESAIGIIASSVPAMHKLKQKKSGAAHVPYAPKPTKSLVTFGSLPARNPNFNNPTDQGVTFTTIRGGDWTRIGDGDSEATLEPSQGRETEFGGIRTEYSYQVELSSLQAKADN